MNDSEALSSRFFPGEPSRLLGDAFSAKGLVSRFVPGFEERPEQLRMALSVWKVIQSGGRLLAEAGTGTGKSLAYLLPVLLASSRNGKRAIVSTHTVNLQQQLVKKDIPLVAGMLKELGFEARYAIFKGRSHYLCRRRWDQTFSQIQEKLSLFTPDDTDKAAGALYDRIAGKDWDGDRDSLGFAVPDSLWADVCSEGDRCMSGKCRFKDECFYQAQKKSLEKCHLIVVNHALLLSHLTIQNESKGQTGLLPAFETVILDEAHHIEDVTRSSQGAEISEFRMKRLSDDVIRKTATGDLAKVINKDVVRSIRASLDDLASSLGASLRAIPLGAKDKMRLRDPDCLGPAFGKKLRETGASMKDWEELDLSEEERFEVSALRKRIGNLASDLENVNLLEGSADRYVYWVEAQEGHRRRQVTIKRCPLEVGNFLGEALWSAVPCCVLTSATLAVNRTFDYLKGMLGLSDTEEIIVGSPFDFGNQALLCVPRDSRGREVNSPEFSDYIARTVLDVVDLARGRTFVLFTNRRALQRVARQTRDSIEERGYPVQVQGEASREALLAEFREVRNGVLFGLDSFWEGVDVPGEALSCVILTKLPFPVPDDPVMEAREELWKLRGLVPFTYYSLPLATLKLKQGFGRLIRTKTDRGAVVLLDPRILTKSYGKSVLNSLPPARFTDDIDDVARAVL